MIPDVQLVKFMMLMLQNRSFYVTTSSRERSRNRQLRTGLPQGSVLAPILFNIYIADNPATLGNKYLVHTKSVDVVLNDAMRIISGTLKPTPTEVLPVVSGIHPPNIRRNFSQTEIASSQSRKTHHKTHHSGSRGNTLQQELPSC
ncbi:hypothetical protein JOB18_000299 [Solea senegalensis]|uniref:Reverse transcriptase domain-containing protein n=1 Tax=Solea senegalensis TaxID=28829 RepID=A0AAV6PB75_SOLSE|nr:hypothetical protein JOB18_000299 [Solea senegalensis]